MSFIRRSWQTIGRIAKFQPEKIYVGKDLNGNKYYESPKQTYFFGIMSQSMDKRLVIPIDEQERINSMNTLKVGREVPYEWESWLRRKRNDPPSLDEIELNNIKAMQVQQRVKTMQNKQTEIKEHLDSGVDKQHSSIYYKKKEEIQEVESWTPGKK